VYSIEKTAVELSLLRKARKGITITFELVPDKLAIDYSDVHSSRAGPDAHFLDNASITVTSVLDSE